MKAEYLNHYLTDRDVANFARQSFATLADNFTEAQNNNLVRFLARGMASGDWEKLVNQLFDLGKVDYAAPDDSPMEAKNRQAAKDLMAYLRKIPEHWVPFGHPHISLRMQAPIPIRVQCFKHKIGFVESEESRRYISTKPEAYLPDAIRAAAASVKQGSGGIHPDSDAWREGFSNFYEFAIALYEQAIEEGICPEQARFILPQGCEVNWVWTGSLYAFANFYNQRSDSHAQAEIQELAKQVDAIIAPLYPVSWAALTKGDY
jgi:thymidylate synthase (FAD)